MGGGAKVEGMEPMKLPCPGGPPRDPYEEAADRGRGPPPIFGVETGKAARELVLGVKSKSGANNGATPY